jgi:hypothetical protein
MDDVTAFINADVKSEIFVEQPNGYKVYNDERLRVVGPMKKVFYGFREAPKA